MGKTANELNSNVPRYLADVLKMAELSDLEPGRLYLVRVCHDDWCNLLANKGQCSCNPVVKQILRKE